MIRRALRLSCWVVVAITVAAAFPAMAQAAGNDVAQNLGSVARHYGREFYGGIVAVIGLVFLINRRYTELGLFFVAAIMVAWLVFSPDQIAHAARGIGDRIF